MEESTRRCLAINASKSEVDPDATSEASSTACDEVFSGINYKELQLAYAACSCITCTYKTYLSMHEDDVSSNEDENDSGLPFNPTAIPLDVVVQCSLISDAHHVDEPADLFECKLHGEKQLDHLVFCQDCETIGCIKCVQSSTHAGHRWGSVDQSKVKEVFNREFCKLQQHLGSQIRFLCELKKRKLAEKHVAAQVRVDTRKRMALVQDTFRRLRRRIRTELLRAEEMVTLIVQVEAARRCKIDMESRSERRRLHTVARRTSANCQQLNAVLQRRDLDELLRVNVSFSTSAEQLDSALCAATHADAPTSVASLPQLVQSSIQFDLAAEMERRLHAAFESFYKTVRLVCTNACAHAASAHSRLLGADALWADAATQVDTAVQHEEVQASVECTSSHTQTSLLWQLDTQVNVDELVELRVAKDASSLLLTGVVENKDYILFTDAYNSNVKCMKRTGWCSASGETLFEPPTVLYKTSGYLSGLCFVGRTLLATVKEAHTLVIFDLRGSVHQNLRFVPDSAYSDVKSPASFIAVRDDSHVLVAVDGLSYIYELMNRSADLQHAQFEVTRVHRLTKKCSGFSFDKSSGTALMRFYDSSIAMLDGDFRVLRQIRLPDTHWTEPAGGLLAARGLLIVCDASKLHAFRTDGTYLASVYVGWFCSLSVGYDILPILGTPDSLRVIAVGGCGISIFHFY